MTCKECSARRQLARDALLRSAVGETVAHVAKGAAEMVGIKKKTASAERKEVVVKCEEEEDIAGNNAGSTNTAQE